ncbi:MAG: hypothetical protein Q9222_007753 [Ikaeria aurantiellina]
MAAPAAPAALQDTFRTTMCYCTPDSDLGIAWFSFKEYYSVILDRSFSMESECAVHKTYDYCVPVYGRRLFQCEENYPESGHGVPDGVNRLCYLAQNEYQQAWVNNKRAFFGFNGVTRALEGQKFTEAPKEEVFDFCNPVCLDRTEGPAAEPMLLDDGNGNILSSYIRTFDELENIETCDGCAPEYQDWDYVDTGGWGILHFDEK